ncbi:MAG TPA: TonB-dependent receptor, partial [Flavisolibacter sp.]|nr:TonB-dependent receptor [Flavisolibacter sp.]
LLAARDSSVIKYTAADKTGKFSFEDVRAGKYLVAVSAVGHVKKYSEVTEISEAQKSVALKHLELQTVSRSLTGVTVTAKKPLVEQKIDRTVINVEAAITNAGSTAMEVLEKSPGISVDKDGNISLKGKAGVVVLIDGRPTQLGAADLANMLRSMHSSQMDQIEIMTNPPAKFDAAGNAGVINIKTKKNKQFGYNGSLNAGIAQGVYTRYNEGANLNYRKNKVNLFANFSHSYNKRDERLNIQRNFMNSDTKELLYRFEQQGIMTNKRNSFNGKLGLDYSFNPKTTIGFVASGFTSPNSFQNLNTTDKSVLAVVQEQTRSVSRSNETFKNLSTNVNFRRQLDSAGREITADLDYLTYRGNTSMTLLSNYFNSKGEKTFTPDTLYGGLPQIINIYSGKVDYVHPLKNGARFEAGIKTSIVKTDNNAVYDTMNNGRRQRDLFRSNHFIYEENINAAYVNLSMTFNKKWNGQFGLRAENTEAKGTQLTTGERFTPSYTQLFPTAYVQYKMNEKNNFGLNYGRRIRRPNYESLNPFIEYIDQYTFQQGNPNLKPQFSHNGELSHTYNNILTTTLNYTKTTDIIQQIIDQNEERSETFVRQANIANQRQLGLALSAGFPVNKWWTSNLYANIFNNRFEGVVGKSPVELSGTTVMFNGSQQFKVGKTTSLELSGWYRSPGVEGVMLIGSMGSVSMGFSQQVLKNMGTVRLTVRDIFDTQNVSGKSRYGNIDAAFQNGQDNRVVNLGFTYRFSKGKMNGSQKRKAGGSASDEQNRVGGGNGN